jgi:membrane protein YqaA with SNARE-associated domain
MTEEVGLVGLFISGFLSATFLPGNSELALIAYLRHFPTVWGIPVVIATLGNTLGAITTYYIARLLPRPKANRTLHQVERFGAPLLLFSGLPIIGDALCIAAGWLRMHIMQVVYWVSFGKLIRYLGVVFLNNLWK